MIRKLKRMKGATAFSPLPTPILQLPLLEPHPLSNIALSFILNETREFS